MPAEDKLYDFRPPTANLDKLKQHAHDSQNAEDGMSKHTLDLYKSFMHSYVKRINDATFNVTIGGIRIGSAKYTRLAQINLKSKVITFSRFAIENVPERGRRYLVLHELAHVLEASHNNYFWQLVGRFEPDYKDIGSDLDMAFKKNVRSHERGSKRPPKTGDYHMHEPGRGQQHLELFRQNKLLWTPDHGYIEHGNRRLGLHKDQVENFANLGLDNRLEDEAFRAYIDLRREEIDPDCQLTEEQLPDGNEDDCNEKCSFNTQQSDDHLYSDDDENYTDNYFGTMSGGEAVI